MQANNRMPYPMIPAFCNTLSTLPIMGCFFFQIKMLNMNCSALKRDLVKSQEIANNELQMRQHLEEQVLKYRKESGKIGHHFSECNLDPKRAHIAHLLRYAMQIDFKLALDVGTFIKDVFFFCYITESHNSLVKQLESDKEFLMSELGKMKARYNELHGQIDQMGKLVDEKQVYHMKNLFKIYDVPMKFASKLIHGWPVHLCYGYFGAHCSLRYVPRM